MMKPIRLSLAVLLSFSPLVLMAQAQATTQAAEKHEAPAASHEAKAAGHEGQSPEGHGASEAIPGEGAHEAGHEAGHHGPAMKLFGKEYGNGGAFLVQLLNFAIYGAALFFLLKGALSAMFKSRKEELEAMLSQAERDRAEGEAQMKAMEVKMAGLEGEMAGILEKAKAEAEAEKQHVLAAATAEATLILSQVQTEIGYQQRQAELELRALVAELTVEGAAKRLEAKLQGPEAAKAVDRAIQQIGGAQ
jgi:F-type H+-transporting ATPase subunit b